MEIYKENLITSLYGSDRPIIKNGKGEKLIEAMKSMIEDPNKRKLITLMIKTLAPKVAGEIKSNPNMLMDYLKKGLRQSGRMDEIPESPNDIVDNVAEQEEEFEPKSSLAEAAQDMCIRFN